MKRTVFSLLLILLFALEHAVGQVVSKNSSQACFLGYQSLYSGQSIDPATAETLADVASWRDSRNGKEYALVCLIQAGTASGVALVEVTNPVSPFHLKTIRRSIKWS